MDLAEIEVETICLVNSLVVESDFSTGLTGLNIYQDKDSLYLVENNAKKSLDKVSLDRTIHLSVVINGQKLEQEFKLGKGKIFILSYCREQVSDGSVKKFPKIVPYNGKVIFE